MIFWIGLIIGFILYIYKVYAKEVINHYRFAKTVPGPPYTAILSKTSKDMIQWYKDLYQRYGSTFRLWVGKDLFIVFTEPEDIKAILSSNQLLTKSVNYDVIRPWLGNGLLTNSGSSWHQRRKLLTPAFHFKILSSFREAMEQKCDILISRLNEVADGKAVDIYPYITLFALDVISETAMGTKKYVQEKMDSDFSVATQRICSVLFSQIISMWNRIPFVYNFSKSKQERDKLLSILHAETEKTIRDRRKYLINSNIKSIADVEENEFGIKRRLAFLDILILSQMDGANLSDEDIREEVDTFMFEGHDTTTSAISFAIYLLAKHPNIQQKAREECIELQGKESETMKYLEAVIKETLRLYPSVPFFSRRTTEPFKIGDRLIPVGVFVSNNSFLLHRNESIYVNAEVFNPERFLSGREYHPYSFIGFSAGPRNCIGQKFAMLELKCTLSKILRNFDIFPVDGFEPILIPELILKSDNGIHVRLRAR